MFKMTPNILRNLITDKATRLYPFETREPWTGVRGELGIDIEKCTFCGICALKCPTGCLSVNKKEGLWICDPFVCVYCGVCVESCPKKCLYQDLVYREAADEHGKIVMKGEPPRRKKEAET
ncbi:MAG: 4Fe-4S binding protein [Desulfobacteraceae bacterium]|nr:4Fe-4S binding protein [Desulfobacteraceae bacterium]